MDSDSVLIQLKDGNENGNITGLWLFLNFTSNKTLATENVLEKLIEKNKEPDTTYFLFVRVFLPLKKDNTECQQHMHT